MFAIADDQVFHHVSGRSCVDADAASGYFGSLGRGVCIELENVSVLKQHGLLHHAGPLGQLNVLLQVTVITVHRNKDFGP